MTLVIVAGGTGGHVFPALALYNLALSHNIPCQFVTDERGKRFIPSGVNPVVLDMAGFSGVKAGVLTRGYRVLAGAYTLNQHINRRSILVTFGGYACLSAGVLALCKGLPLVVHEQNAVMGLANRCLSRIAKVIATSQPHTERIPHAALGMVRYTGLPLRAGFLSSIPVQAKDTRQIFLLGGSQGASFFSELAQVITALPDSLKSTLRVVHQVRPEDLQSVQEHYQTHQIKAEVAPFFDNMPERLARSDLVIARSGAASLAELAVVGKPAILIPFPAATHDHQTKNALPFVEKGAALLWTQGVTTQAQMIEDVQNLLENADKRDHMSKQMLSFAKASAGTELLGLVRGLSVA
jgi:UDP-N-acetylglucosamine--N-acetylmuramyl-(pentapeptide) pyrophosphoryl-undecaprenol N-acetylglucosamine transferase